MRCPESLEHEKKYQGMLLSSTKTCEISTHHLYYYRCIDRRKQVSRDTYHSNCSNNTAWTGWGGSADILQYTSSMYERTSARTHARSIHESARIRKRMGWAASAANTTRLGAGSREVGQTAEGGVQVSGRARSKHQCRSRKANALRRATRGDDHGDQIAPKSASRCAYEVGSDNAARAKHLQSHSAHATTTQELNVP